MYKGNELVTWKYSLVIDGRIQLGLQGYVTAIVIAMDRSSRQIASPKGSDYLVGLETKASIEKL